MYILYPTNRHYMYNVGKRVCVQHTHEHHCCTVQDKILECPKLQASELASITLLLCNLGRLDTTRVQSAESIISLNGKILLCKITKIILKIWLILLRNAKSWLILGVFLFRFFLFLPHLPKSIKQSSLCI